MREDDGLVPAVAASPHPHPHPDLPLEGEGSNPAAAANAYPSAASPPANPRITTRLIVSPCTRIENTTTA